MDKVSEVLGELINLKADFVVADESCIICGFPFRKEQRMEAVKQVKHSLLTLLIERLENEKIYYCGINGLPRETEENKTVGRCITAVKELFGEGEK